MSGIARTYVGEIYQLTAITPGCHQHVGFTAMSDEEAIVESAFLRAYHALCAFDPQCRDAWLNGRLKLVCGDRVVSTEIGLEDLSNKK
jgi:hypothetical protein